MAKNVIIVTERDNRKTRAFSNLKKVCEVYGVSYDTVNNYLTRLKRPFETWELRIERAPVE